MSERKSIKQDAKAIWTAIRDDRRARAKLVGAADLAASAKLLATHGEALAELARRIEATTAATATVSTAPETSAPARTKRQRSKKKPGS